MTVPRLRDLASENKTVTWTSASVFGLIGVAFVVHALLAVIVGLSYDETYVVVMARHLSAGYADHPPLTMWLVGIATWLSGGESDLAVRLPTMLLFAGTTWFVYRLGALLIDETAGLYGAIALNMCPLIGVYIGTFAVTDGPMLFGFTGAALYVATAIGSTDRRAAWLSWCLAGLLLGFAMLSKFSAVLLPVGVGLFLVTSVRHRFWLWHPAPYVAALIAGLMVTPVIGWNAEHGWVAFVFQGSRAAWNGSIRPDRMLEYLSIQTLAILPWIWLGLVVVFVAALRRGPKDTPRWFLCCLGAVPVLLFTLVSLVSVGKMGERWASPGYAMLFPLLGSALQDWMKTYSQRVTQVFHFTGAVLLVALVIVTSHLVTNWGRPLLPERDPLAYDFTDWRDLKEFLQRSSVLKPDNFVIATRWEDCVKVDHALSGTMPVACLTNHPLHYAFLRNLRSFLGRDAVIVTSKETGRWPERLASDPSDRSLSGPSNVAVVPFFWPSYGDAFDGIHSLGFDEIQSLGVVTITEFGHRRLTLNVFIGKNSREAKILPEDFDPNTYVSLYPDLIKAGVDGRQHYMKHGYYEGRRYR